MQTPIRSQKRCLILTGTVIPNSSFVAHGNPTIRRQEYFEALSFYSSAVNEPIYFLENSSYDFTEDYEFQTLFSGRKIELVKFPVSSEVERGKGFQEFEMIDGTIERLSKYYDSFFKISGRYKVTNIGELTDCDCHGLIIDRYRRRGIAVTAIFCTTFEFYKKYLMSLYLKVDDSKGQYVERIVYDAIRDKNLGKQVQLLPRSPRIVGTTGSQGIKLEVNTPRLLIRSFLRRILTSCSISEFIA